MGRARNQSTNSVTLFPFLAVLICAMGALIFLLLAMTQRIREEVREEHRQQTAQTDPVVETLPSQEKAALPSLSQRESESGSVLSNQLKSQSLVETSPDVGSNFWQEYQRRVTVVKKSNNKPRQSSDSDQKARLEVTLGSITQLEKERDLAKTRFANAQATYQQELASQKKLQQDIQQLEKEMHLADQMVTSQRTKHLNQANSRNDLKLKIARLEQSVKKLQAQPVAQSRYAIIPYEGKTGTTRKPIFLECTDRGIQFQPEKILLGPEDFSGFTLHENPLLAGTSALMKYWSEQEDRSGKAKPYVLLIVRPSGSLSYYVARNMLHKLKTNFGYELVPEEFPIAYPTMDPAAKHQCKLAIDLLKHQQREVALQLQHRYGVSPQPSVLNDSRSKNLIPDPSRSGNRSGHPLSNKIRTGTDQSGSDSKELSERKLTFRRGAHGYLEVVDENDSHGFQSTKHITSAWDKALKQPANSPANPPSKPVSNRNPTSTNETISKTQSHSQSASNSVAEFNPQHSPQTLSKSNRNEPQIPAGNNIEIKPFDRMVENSQRGSGSQSELHPRPQPASSWEEQFRKPRSSSPDSWSMAARNSTQRTEEHLVHSSKSSTQKKQKWGLVTSHSGIGLKRTASVYLSARELQIERLPGLKLTRTLEEDQILDWIVTQMEIHAKSWGYPPKGFYWVPAIRFYVAPDSEPLYERLRESLERNWNLQSQKVLWSPSDQNATPNLLKTQQ